MPRRLNRAGWPPSFAVASLLLVLPPGCDRDTAPPPAQMTQPAAEAPAPAEPSGGSARAKFDQIHEGMSREAVTALLGQPARVDEQEPDGTVEIDWDGGIVTEDGRPHRVEITINFRDGKVVGKEWDLDPLGGWPAR